MIVITLFIVDDYKWYIFSYTLQL